MSIMEAQGMSAGPSSPESGGVDIFCRYSPQPALVVRSRVARDEVAPYVRAALAQLRRNLEKQHESAVDPAFIAYRELSATDVDIEVGVPVADATALADGSTEIGAVPMGRYAGLRLPLGAELHQAYRTLRDWLAHHAEHGTGPVYTTLVPGQAPASFELLVQRRICGGQGAAPESETKNSLFDGAGSQIAEWGLLELVREATPAPAATSALDRPWQYLRKLGKGVIVQDVMTQSVLTCARSDSLSTVAHRMWEHDIGALPVVGKAASPIAMITDRDICMAAYTQGKPLSEIPVSSAMSRALYLCQNEDSLVFAEEKMAAHQVRRLPVVDAHGALVGIISMNDIVLARARSGLSVWMERMLGDVTLTYAAISQHRQRSRAQSS